MDELPLLNLKIVQKELIKRGRIGRPEPGDEFSNVLMGAAKRFKHLPLQNPEHEQKFMIWSQVVLMGYAVFVYQQESVYELFKPFEDSQEPKLEGFNLFQISRVIRNSIAHGSFEVQDGSNFVFKDKKDKKGRRLRVSGYHFVKLCLTIESLTFLQEFNQAE